MIYPGECISITVFFTLTIIDIKIIGGQDELPAGEHSGRILQAPYPFQTMMIGSEHKLTISKIVPP